MSAPVNLTPVERAAYAAAQARRTGRAAEDDLAMFAAGLTYNDRYRSALLAIFAAEDALAAIVPPRGSESNEVWNGYHGARRQAQARLAAVRAAARAILFPNEKTEGTPS